MDSHATKVTRRVALQSGAGLALLALSESSCDGDHVYTALMPPTRDKTPDYKLRPLKKTDFDRLKQSLPANPVVMGKPLRLRLVRPEDGLDLSFRLYRLQNSDGSHRKFGLLVADFPGQALIQPPTVSNQQAASDDCSTDAHVPTQQYTRLSAPSRIGMLLQHVHGEFDVADVLDWFRHPLFLGSGDFVGSDIATTLVMPAGLNLQPAPNQLFFATADTHRDGGVRQLWTARLVNATEPLVGPDLQFSVTKERRPKLVLLSDRVLADDAEMFPQKSTLDQIVAGLKGRSIDAKRLIVSSQGSWLEAGAAWQPTNGQPCSLSSFYERIAHGIEQDVEATYLVRLCPHGHVVTLVFSAKLQWCRKDANSPLHAEYVLRAKLVYTQTDKDFRTSDLEAARRAGFYAPTNSVRLVGKESPFLNVEDAQRFVESCQAGTYVPYWANVVDESGRSVPYQFPVEITDRAGQSHTTTMPMLVAMFGQEKIPTYRRQVIQAYGESNLVDFHRERVGYAIPTSAGNTSYPTQSITFLAGEFSAGAGNLDSTPWYPVMSSAAISLEQVDAFSDAGAQPVFRNAVYARQYRDDPFDVGGRAADARNRAEVMLALDDRAPFNFAGRLGGGIAKPTSSVIGLARKAGTLFSFAGEISAELDQIAQNGMKVSQIFDALSTVASLFGAVNLADILEEVSDGIAEASKLPQLAAQQIRDLEADAVAQLRKILQPLLNLLAQEATQTILSAAAEISDIYNTVQQSFQFSARLLRVLATEKTANDITWLASQSLDTAIQTGAQQLSTLVTLPVAERIDKVKSTLFPVINGVPQTEDFPGPWLPTLYVLRDYSVATVVEKVESSNFIEALDAALQTGADAFQSTVDQLFVDAATAIQKLADSPVVRLCLAARDLNNALNQNPPDPATIVTDLNAVVDAATAILPAKVLDEYTAFATSIKQSVQNQADMLAFNLRNRITMLQSAIQSTGDVLQQEVRDKINKALLSTIPSALKTPDLKRLDNVVSSIAQGINKLSDYWQTLESVANIVSQAMDLLKAIQRVTVQYNYQTNLRSFGPFVASFNGRRSRFQLNSQVQIGLTQPDATFTVHAAVNDFELHLVPGFEFVAIGFAQATFDWNGSSHPVVQAPIDPKNVKLLGPLDFISGLANAMHLPANLAVQVSAAGAIIGYNLIIPPIASGAFNIVNLSLYTALKLNFDGTPMRAIFGFASPNHRFTVTYFFLGGGGFLDLEFTPESSAGSMIVTGAIEVGAMAALDFGIAGGDVHVFLGIYFSISPTDVTLSGYFRAGGEIEVLGIVSVSLEFVMSLTYEDRNGQAWLSGDCEMEVDVSVLFFSESVTLHLHHDFAGNAMS